MPVRLPYGPLLLALFLPFCVMVIPCRAQIRDALCSNGSGNFGTDFHTGVKLRVGAARQNEGGLATRVCEATLRWDKREIIVAAKASQLDVDVFGVDLGVGVPVVAFQVKSSDAECCMAYQIYSLQKPPRLLRIITGGNFFSASDKDLDGRVEIWTADTAAVDGFEKLAAGELDFGPMIVLRFERNRVVDVSSEFRPHFDREIAKLQAKSNSGDLQDFKNSDGKLTSTSSASLPAQRLHKLRAAKIKVLEIAWSYLYSGREEEAWRSLTDLWPASDVDRIWAAMLNAHSHGIRAQVEGTSSGAQFVRKKRAMVFDAAKNSERNKSEVIPPHPILLQRPAPLASDQRLTDSEFLFDLVVDSAGKVRSIEPGHGAKSSDADTIESSAMGWTFVPAFKDGRAVASRLRLAVSAKR